jgi:hypothetical protein
MSETLEHLTLTTGHSRLSPRAEVVRGTIDFIRDCLAKHDGQLGSTGWQVRLIPIRDIQFSYCFDLYWQGKPLVHCFLCAHLSEHEQMWAALHATGLTVTALGAVAKQPSHVPWLAVGLNQPLLASMRGDPQQIGAVMMEAGDLERCVAWTLLT